MEPLEIRLVREEEVQEWRGLMRQHHYLGDARMVGEMLRYVAFVDGKLVALLAWAAAALRNGPRDAVIGWKEAQKAKQLHSVVNNVRFLVLPWVRQPHLASKILGANLRRLRQDWQARHGHEVVLAETFVDAERFKGTCYRAGNWMEVGKTKGFSRTGGSYRPNGRPKTVFLYRLRKDAYAWLRGEVNESRVKRPKGAQTLSIAIEQLPLEGPGGLFQALEKLQDPRKRRGVSIPLR